MVILLKTLTSLARPLKIILLLFGPLLPAFGHIWNVCLKSEGKNQGNPQGEWSLHPNLHEKSLFCFATWDDLWKTINNNDVSTIKWEDKLTKAGSPSREGGIRVPFFW